MTSGSNDRGWAFGRCSGPSVFLPAPVEELCPTWHSIPGPWLLQPGGGSAQPAGVFMSSMVVDVEVPQVEEHGTHLPELTEVSGHT